MEKDDITGRGRQKERVKARALLCYWTVVELEMSMVDLAQEFDLTPVCISYAVQREEKMPLPELNSRSVVMEGHCGEKMVKERSYQRRIWVS